ncbi:hypothetical protein [Cuspidothrix issatschenkoi]|uniref:hypothetical protein n=1 Tax=Cuspidothrix issatschenkoi TaxID=230752 RepID=UPI002AD4A27E|nr:hypothetical protein [Cuspidothrix issatschenkoi]
MAMELFFEFDELEGKIKTVTITKNCSDQCFAAILFEDGKEKPESITEGKAIGIDLGLTHFAITSDGSKFDHPRILNKHEKNLKIKQQNSNYLENKKVLTTEIKPERKLLEFTEK